MREVRRCIEVANNATQFGDPEKQKEFINSHINLLESLHALEPALNAALASCDTSTLEGRVLYFLGRMIIEDDFNAILILYANGFSNSAKQILRGMFERTVTLAYLNRHPDELGLFYEYGWVDRHKRLPEYIAQLGDKISQESIKETEKNFERVRGNYLRTVCKKCDKTVVNHMWSKKDLITMAKECGFKFEVIQTAYYDALNEAHPKVGALLDRIEVAEDGSLWYKVAPDTKKAEIYLIVAGYLFFKALELLADHFKADELNKALEQAKEGWLRQWPPTEEAG